MKFRNRVHHDLNELADQASPSPHAWEQLQDRLDAVVDQPLTEVTMSPSPALNRRLITVGIGLAAAAVVVVAAIVATDRSSATIQTEPDVTEVPVSTISTPTETTHSTESESASELTVPATSPTTAPATTTAPIRPGGTAEDPRSLPLTGTAMGPGWYRTTQLSHPPAHPNLIVELPVDTPMTVSSQRTSAFVLVEGDGQDGVLPAVDVAALEFARLGSWSNTEEATDPTVGLASIASDDLDGWIEANDVVVGNRRTVIVDGVEAQVFDVEVAPTAPTVDELCSATAEPCLWMGSVEGASLSGTPETNREQRPHELLLQSSTINRVWVVPIEGFDPLVVRAIAPVAEPEWLDQIEASTIADLRVMRDATS